MSSYKTECPKCAGNALYVTPHNGVSYCFKCGYYENDSKEEVIRYKERSPHLLDIRDFYTGIAKYYHSCLTKEARSFLYQRGYDDTLIERKLIGFCPLGKSTIYASNISKLAGLAGVKNHAFLAGRITFPYYKGGIVTDIRGRSMNKHEIKYLSPYGDSYARGADYPYNYNSTVDNDIIVLTEGEIKSDLSDKVGIPTIGLPGMRIWKNGFVQREDQQIVICFDSQAENSADVDRAIYQIAQHIDRPKIATLPLMGQSKMDIDTFILQFGGDLYKMVINAAIDFDYWLKLKRMKHERSYLLR